MGPRTSLLAALALAGAANAAPQSFRLAGPDASLQSGPWAWDGGSHFVELRAALEDGQHFGPFGTVGRPIELVDLGTVTTASLAPMDAFVWPWWADASVPPGAAAALMAWFLDGGSLILLQDDTGHDLLGELLGVPALPTASDATPSTGGEPLFHGPFGQPASVLQAFSTGHVSPVDVAAKGGRIAAANASGEVTAALWGPGEYAPGAGALLILGDVDMVTDGTATYSPLNDNGRFALNAFAWAIASDCEACLSVDVHTLSLASGGTQTFALAGGAASAGLTYLLLGSLGGAAPGFPIDGQLLPLAVDPYTLQTLFEPGAPPLAGSLGVLDPAGTGSAAFTISPGLPLSFAGLVVHHAYVVIELTPTLLSVPRVSNAVALTFTP